MQCVRLVRLNGIGRARREDLGRGADRIASHGDACPAVVSALRYVLFPQCSRSIAEYTAVHPERSSASASWCFLVGHTMRLTQQSPATDSVMNRTITHKSLWLVENQCPLSRMFLRLLWLTVDQSFPAVGLIMWEAEILVVRVLSKSRAYLSNKRRGGFSEGHTWTSTTTRENVSLMPRHVYRRVRRNRALVG
jgi:hypothetical protein